MEKQLIIERLQATINELEKLAPANFRFESYISEYAGTCGTVCCVAGWYPRWFPDSELIWTVAGSGDVELSSKFGMMTSSRYIKIALKEYHGLDGQTISALFFGTELENVLPNVGFHVVSLRDAIVRFKKVLNHIQNENVSHS